MLDQTDINWAFWMRSPVIQKTRLGMLTGILSFASLTCATSAAIRMSSGDRPNTQRPTEAERWLEEDEYKIKSRLAKMCSNRIASFWGLLDAQRDGRLRQPNMKVCNFWVLHAQPDVSRKEAQEAIRKALQTAIDNNTLINWHNISICMGYFRIPQDVFDERRNIEASRVFAGVDIQRAAWTGEIRKHFDDAHKSWSDIAGELPAMALEIRY